MDTKVTISWCPAIHGVCNIPFVLIPVELRPEWLISLGEVNPVPDSLLCIYAGFWLERNDSHC